MQKNNRISVITTLFNYGHYIEDCINSVMSQSNVDFEMLVVDDGSTDNGPSLVSKLTRKFKNLTLIKLNKNYGYSTAKNIGIKESSGDILVMLDADDMLLPGSLQIRKKHIDSGYDFVHGYALNFSGNKRSESELRKKWVSGKHDKLRWKFIHPQCVMLNKNIHEIVGMYDENLKCKSDREMWARICNRDFSIKYVDSPVALYRLHNNQMHKSKWKLSNNKRLANELMSLVEIRKQDISDCISLSNYVCSEKIMAKEKYSTEEAIEIAKKDASILYDEDFFSKRDTKLHDWSFAMGKYAAEKLGIKSIIDFGCGIGSFISGAKAAGVPEVRGLEIGYENAKNYLVEGVKDFISYGNVAIPSDFGKFDCSVSIEVAEHLLPSNADAFVDNLCNSSDRIIILTAARPNQIGMYHFNCQEKEYWIDKIAKRGFTFRQDLTEKIANGWKKRCNGIPNYLTKNLMIFKSSEKCSGNLIIDKKKINNTIVVGDNISFSFDLPDNESSGKHKFFQRMRESLRQNGFKIKKNNEKSDIHFYINTKNKLSRVNIKRLDGVYFDGTTFTRSRNSSLLNTIKSSDGVIYQSNYCRDMGCKILGFDWRKKPHAVIYNGCDFKEFDVQPIEMEVPYFLALCKWRRHKRLKETVEGFISAKLNAKLVVAGPSDYTISHKDVIYVGDLDRYALSRYIKGCAATVHLAWIDWCPNSVVESIVAGKQVIHTDSGGTMEIVNGRGYVVRDKVWHGEVASPKNPPHLDLDSVAYAMKMSIDNPILNFTTNDLSIEKTVNEYIEFGKKILRSKF